MTPEPSRPELFSTSTKGASRLPILALVAVLVGIVVVTRLGGSDQTTTSTPTHRPGSPTSTPGPVAPTPPFDPGAMVGLIPVSADGLSYADGIPVAVDGVPVIRVHDALLLPLGRTELVAGWYRTSTCGRPHQDTTCPSPTLSDVPLQQGLGDVRTEFVALDQPLDGFGGRVVLATTEEDPGCSIHADGGACQARLRVAATVWTSRDVLTGSSADDDLATLDLIAAVNGDPDHFAGSFIADGQLVVLYVDEDAKNALQRNLQRKVSSGVAVHWRKVDRSWTQLLRIVAEVRNFQLEGVSAVAIDTIYNRVDVFYDGLPIEVAIRLQDQYDGAVAFFRGPPAGEN